MMKLSLLLLLVLLPLSSATPLDLGDNTEQRNVSELTADGSFIDRPFQTDETLSQRRQILVNKDNFEILEWKDGSYGSVPKNSVQTCPGEDIYVGQNKYGLGKVSTQDKCFYLPWKGSEYWYRDYQVLTINENIVSQKIYDVKYITDESKTFQYPPEIMRKTVISNNECSPVTKTDTLTQSYEEHQKWDISFSISVGVSTIIETGIPLFIEGRFQVSTEVAFQYSQGNTVTKTTTDTVTVVFTAPPNHSCTATMNRLKYKLNIPFTALFSRTYGNGEIHTTSITGTYDSVQTAEVQTVLDRCEVLNNSKPCT
ncbi:natterin-3-like isoform X2 [Acanthopagrus latus]|uniref:natterin-3-like isoform X2 n=1 Tax=Acanthopagrus latus TaxID=8177 RepID=UPI00187C0B4C|nr:natterin-3-like isoform X2 [Acanthopagrus latus]